MRLLLAIILSSCLTLVQSGYAKAIVGPADPDFGAWAPITLQVPIYRRLSGYFEAQPRWQRLPQWHFAEMITRSGLSYDLNSKWSVAGGYYFSPHFYPKLNMENRIWEQLSFSHQVGHWKFQNRTRLEEIWQKSYEGASFRLRDQLKVSYQLGKSPWYMVAAEEPFFNIDSNDSGPERGFNQNRLFLGIGRQLGETTRIECGYLNQYKNGQDGKHDLINHVLIAQVAIDLRKLKLPQSWKLASKTPNAVSQ